MQSTGKLALLAKTACVLWCIFLSCHAGKDVYKLEGVYAGWLGRQNMGDELVLDIFGALLAESIHCQLNSSALGNSSAVRVSLESEVGGILQVDSRGIRRVRRPTFNYRDFDFAILGGGSLLEPIETIWGPFCEAARRARLPVYLHATGTQISGGLGIRSSTESLRCIQNPAFGGLRGPITSKMLGDLVAQWNRSNTRRDVSRRFNTELPIISDSGILTSHVFARQAAPIVGLVDKQRSPAGVICISGFPQGLDAALLVRAWAAKHTVVLMPVDHMNLVKVNEMLNNTFRREPGLRNRIFVNHHLTNYGVWLALLDRCNVMLTSRLHSMIVSASAQTPFRIFEERRRSQLKMHDFLLNTFSEKLDSFKLPCGWRGSMQDVEALMGSRNADAWKQRYNESYRARAVLQPYEAHIKAMTKLVSSMMPSTGFTGFTDARVSITRHFDRATVQVVFR